MHTPLDHAALIAAGVDPDSTQPREKAVTCQTCGRLTFNQAAHCDDRAHYVVPHAARFAELHSHALPADAPGAWIRDAIEVAA